MKFFWIFKALRVMTLVSAKVPAILRDGVVTVEEAVGLLIEVLRMFDLDLDIKVPGEVDQVMEVKIL